MHEPHFTVSGDLDHAAFAAEPGISENALRTAFHREYCEIQRAEVASTLPEGDDIDSELRHLLTESA